MDFPWEVDEVLPEARERFVPRQPLRAVVYAQCVLSPDAFDNEKFWRLVCERHLDLSLIQAVLKTLAFHCGLHDYDRILLSSTNDADTFARWPDLEAVFRGLLPIFEGLERGLESFEGLENFEGLTKGLLELHDLLADCIITPNEEYKQYLFGRLQRELFNDRKEAGLGIPPVLDPTGEAEPHDPAILPGFWGFQDQPSSTHDCASVMLNILAGVMAALGALAVVLAFTVLAPPVTVATVAVAAVGISSVLGGIGLFKWVDGSSTNVPEPAQPPSPI